MKIKFVVITNNISPDELVRNFDSSLASHFQDDGIDVCEIKLIDLVGIGRMPTCLSDWVDYEKVIIISNTATVGFFLDVEKIIKNVELWVISWPKEIASSDRPDMLKFFDTLPEMSLKAKETMAE